MVVYFILSVQYAEYVYKMCIIEENVHNKCTVVQNAYNLANDLQ